MNYATYYEKLGQKYTDEWAKEAKKYEAAGIATGKFYTDKYAKLYGNAPEKDDLMNLNYNWRAEAAKWEKEGKKYEAAGNATGKFYTDKYAKLYGNAPEKDDLMNLLSRFSLQNLVSDVEKNV